MTSPISNRSNDPNTFDIPTSQAQTGRFPQQASVALKLSQNAAGRYEVYRKDIPNELQGRMYRQREITWLNNFGLKERGKPEFANIVPAYEVHIQSVPSASTYVYYDGSNIQTLDFHVDPDDDSRIVAELTLGDPAIGWI